MNLHGYNRITGDLDIIISLTDENIGKFIAVSHELGLVPRLPVRIEDIGVEELRTSWTMEKNIYETSIPNLKLVETEQKAHQP